MNFFQHTVAAMALFAAAGATVAAQDTPHKGMDMSMPTPQGMQMPMSTSAAGDTAPLTRGVIKKIDTEQGKLTIQHEALENLGMPGMTMVFGVADRALLKDAQVGQAIAFRAERIAGAITVTQLKPRQ